MAVAGERFHLIVKLPILGSDSEVLYLRTGETVAHEAGALIMLESIGMLVPEIFLGLTYKSDEDLRFGIVASDLTCGGSCRLERPPIEDMGRNHAVIQISADGSRRTIFCDAKTFEQGNEDHVHSGAPFIAPGAIIDLGSLD